MELQDYVGPALTLSGYAIAFVFVPVVVLFLIYKEFRGTLRYSGGYPYVQRLAYLMYVGMGLIVLGALVSKGCPRQQPEPATTTTPNAGTDYDADPR